MKWIRPSAALTAALVALACGGNDTASRAGAPDTTRAAAAPADTAPPPVYCSASTLEAEPPPQPGLPEAVAATRAAVVRAAVACDYAALDSLAADGFTYSFGNGASPGEFWRDAEAEDGQPLRYLVQTLALPWFRPDSSLYIWPSVFTDEPTEEDWAVLEGIYSADEIAAYREIGFIGWRAGITPDGEWSFFVAGD